MRKKKIKKPIAFKDGVESKENLPYPIVLYPGFYGAFFAFKNKKDNTFKFCSCSKEAIENYIEIRIRDKEMGRIGNSSSYRSFILDSMEFPFSFVESLYNKKVDENRKILKWFNFENRICHECNRITPAYRYCHEMYGGVFKQNYGWYIQKQAIQYGVFIGNRLVGEFCPKEILDLLEINPNTFNYKFRSISEKNHSEGYELSLKFNKQMRKVWNIIENEVRIRFGHKKIGEAWTSETILYFIVKNIFNKMPIHRHYRPDFLNGLELDIYLPDLKLGLEYQGYQHFKPVSCWGGKEGLIKTKERDKKKNKLCDKLGINLVYFTYNEDLSEEIVKSKLKKYV